MGNEFVIGQGYEMAKERNDELAKMQEKFNRKWLAIKDGEEVTVRFLTSDPWNVFEHSLEKGKKKCTCPRYTFKRPDLACPICDAGIKASYRAYFPVLDKRDGEVKEYSCGSTTAARIEKLLKAKGDMTNRDVGIIRTGGGTTTTYDFNVGDVKPEKGTHKLPNLGELLKPLSVVDMKMLLASVKIEDDAEKVKTPQKEDF